MANAWLAHVKKTLKSNKGMKFGQVLKLAKKTYKKGGADVQGDFGPKKVRRGGEETGSVSDGEEPPVEGARRRRRTGRKTRRTRRSRK